MLPSLFLQTRRFGQSRQPLWAGYHALPHTWLPLLSFLEVPIAGMWGGSCVALQTRGREYKSGILLNKRCSWLRVLHTAADAGTESYCSSSCSGLWSDSSCGFFFPQANSTVLDWHRQRGGPEQSTRLSVSSIDIIVFIIITATNTIIIFNI